MMTDAANNRIFILGSCVSRDAFEIPGHGFNLVGYIARTSLASAFTARSAPRDIIQLAAKIGSAFQRRMVEIDLRKRALSLISSASFDYLLIDLIDERFNLARFAGSNVQPEVFTLSRELAAVCNWPGAQVVPGTNQHLSAWKRGVGQLLRNMPPERIIVNRAFWATTMSDGTPLEKQSLIEQSNRTLEVMYDYLQRNHVGGVITYPEGIVADPSHKWGVAPFHYAPSMYESLIRQLGEIQNRSAVRPTRPSSTEQVR